MALSERDRVILDLERSWWQHDDSKAEQIRDRLGLSSTRYYQRLGELLDEPDAAALDPLLIHRLRRLRLVKRRARFERRPVGGERGR